jgi:MFS family permease
MTEPDTTTDIQPYVERNYHWNFIVNALDGTTFWFGMSFIASAVILPLYVSHFTTNPIVIGLIPLFSTAGYLFPQLFTANVIERAPLKKFFVVNLGLFLERLPIFLLAPTAYFLAIHQPVLALIAFFVLYGWHTIGAGLILVSWQDLIAKIIPVDRRGRFMGITNFLGNGTGILGALAVPLILAKFAFPLGFVISFAIAAVMVLASWFFLSLAREPVVRSSKPPISQMEYMRSLPEVLRRDRNFRMYLLSQIIFSLSGMATGFLLVYTVKTWNLSDAYAGGFVIALQIGLALANLFFGLLADRKGHKLNLEICLLINVLSLALAIIAPSPLWFFPVFFLRGIVNGGTFISCISIVYEFTDPENRPTYIGLANTLPGVAMIVAPLVGGWMAGALSYQAMFILAAVIGIASWAVMRFAVREPRGIISSNTKSGVEALSE